MTAGNRLKNKYIFYDRRLFQRFSSLVPGRIKENTEDFGTKVYLCDASALGAKLTTERHLHPHEHVTIEVDLLDSERPLTLQGEVVWMKPKEFNIWEVGMKFHKVHLMQTARLYRITAMAAS